MHWHILGAGSIGCLWAAHLSAAGHEVTLIVRNEQRRVQLGQAVLLEQNTEVSAHPVNCATRESCGTIRHLLVTTKAYDVSSALSGISPLLQENASVVLLHNGMGPQQQALEACPQQTVWAATTTDGAWLRKPGHVVFAGKGETRLGRLDDGSDSSLADSLQSLSLSISHDGDIEASLLRKLAINCAINPLTALHRCRNGELCTHRGYQEEMHRVCLEIDQLLHKIGRPLFKDGVFKVACDVAQRTAQNYSSMQQDVQHQRDTEIDFITGYLCQQAREAGLTLVENERLLKQIKKIC